MEYDISYQTSEVDFNEEIQNDLSITKLLRAIMWSIAGVPTLCQLLMDQIRIVFHTTFPPVVYLEMGIQAILDANQEIQTYMAILFILGDSSETIIQAYVEGETE